MIWVVIILGAVAILFGPRVAAGLVLLGVLAVVVYFIAALHTLAPNIQRAVEAQHEPSFGSLGECVTKGEPLCPMVLFEECLDADLPKTSPLRGTLVSCKHPNHAHEAGPWCRYNQHQAGCLDAPRAAPTKAEPSAAPQDEENGEAGPPASPASGWEALPWQDDQPTMRQPSWRAQKLLHDLHRGVNVKEPTP